MSFSDSIKQSLRFRTLDPISRPLSQQLPIKISNLALSSEDSSVLAVSGSKTNTSTSDEGNNSPRPKPPTPIKASP